MEMVKHIFPTFSEVFPDYETFAEWYGNTPLAEWQGAVPQKRTFTILQYEFNDSHIAFSVDSFKQHFALLLYTHFSAFEETTNAIKNLMALTEDEVLHSDIMVTNTAVIPENTSSTNVEEVDFISQQQKQISIKGKLQARREIITNKRAFTVKSFLDKFRFLFIKILSPAYLHMIVEPDHD